jgi:hypothetical protein
VDGGWTQTATEQLFGLLSAGHLILLRLRKELR